MNSDQITIIMVTRNRPISLEKCLARTRSILPKEIPILVFDDASTEGLRVRAIVEAHPNTVYLSSPTLVGPGEGRNRCFRHAVTPFCLSLDDDCYLDSMPDLSRWLADRPEDRDIAAVGFRYRNLPAGDMAPASAVGGITKGFHGGASLLRRETVLKVGGYLDWFVFACEDTEFALRLWRLGYRVWYDPSVIVQHVRSDEGREKRWGSFYYVRNTFLLNVIYGGNIAGLPLGLLRALRRGLFHTDAPGATLTGIFSGLALFLKGRRARKELFGEDRRFSRSAGG
ncbi:MAG: glycosyltransferase [Verrucomicrobiota bacterium]|jgi:GT2 family glycosyltransferase